MTRTVTSGGPQYSQRNSARRGGRIYANQGGNQIIHNHQGGHGGFSGRALLVTLVADAAFFLYGMTAYTGRNTTGDLWRSGIFLGLLVLTGSLLRRWLRRRL